MPTTTPPPGELETATPTTAQPQAAPPPTAELTETLIVGKAADPSIRPFQFHASDEDLADLKRRITATRWPEKETVSDDTQGVQLATIQKLASYWASEYDWRKVEARLELLAAIRHRNRRPRHPLHPCKVEA